VVVLDELDALVLELDELIFPPSPELLLVVPEELEELAIEPPAPPPPSLF